MRLTSLKEFLDKLGKFCFRQTQVSRFRSSVLPVTNRGRIQPFHSEKQNVHISRS
jgi:hypothetical protein